MAPQRPSATIVLPAFNEEALIAKNLQIVYDYLGTIEDRYDWEILVVNDGSSDRTGEIIDDFAATHPGVRTLHHFVNFNLGQALRYAFANARGDYVVTLDSDLSYGPDHIGCLLDTIVETKAKIVIASPYIKGGEVTAVPRFREFMSRAANKLLSMAAKGRLQTVTGMVRAYDRRFLRGLNLKAWDFEINTEIIYKAQLLRAHIVEIPAHLDWSGQKDLGDSRVSSIRVQRSILAQAFSSFLFRPFMFFILPGVLVLLASFYTLGWSTWHTIDAWSGGAGSFSDAVAAAFEKSPHSFLVGGFALLVAIQLISLGILSMQSKRYFEEQFHLTTSVYRETQGPFEHYQPLRGVDLRTGEVREESVTADPVTPEASSTRAL